MRLRILQVLRGYKCCRVQISDVLVIVSETLWVYCVWVHEWLSVTLCVLVCISTMQCVLEAWAHIRRSECEWDNVSVCGWMSGCECSCVNKCNWTYPLYPISLSIAFIQIDLSIYPAGLQCVALIPHSIIQHMPLIFDHPMTHGRKLFSLYSYSITIPRLFYDYFAINAVLAIP